MSLNTRELKKILTTLQKEFGNELNKVIEKVGEQNICWSNDDPVINFYENNSKSIFNANYISIVSDKKIPKCIASVKVSKDKKNAIFCNMYGEKISVPYNKDIFVKINSVPLDDFLFKMW